MPEKLVFDNAERTLRDSGADSIHTHHIDTPPQYGVIAMRSSGLLHIGARTVHSQYTYYTINTAAGGALIEQAVMVGSDAQPTLSGEAAKLTDNLYRALLASIDRALTPPSPETQAKPPLAGAQILPRCQRHQSQQDQRIPAVSGDP
ncbi:hypothetical protein QRB36_17675 [Mycobacterium marseillense]|uniref:hypothetical protein n=1 Tax=Mycobacterium marseillense TaxID=701042 RepID=UPI002596C5B9|nr:hypothetical protein [Mycobacterium marseillense]MDM3975999.1 hypothetical protein [Mycobacterium marseillense]